MQVDFIGIDGGSETREACGRKGIQAGLLRRLAIVLFELLMDLIEEIGPFLV